MKLLINLASTAIPLAFAYHDQWYAVAAFFFGIMIATAHEAWGRRPLTY